MKKIQLGAPGRPGPQIRQLLQWNRIQGAGGLQQYREDPPWGYPQRVSQESV